MAAAAAVSELLSFDCGSLVAYKLDKQAQLAAISFQSLSMCDVFRQHPQVLLLHRTPNAWGKALYVFLADTPLLRPEGEASMMSRVVHVAVPARETAEGLARMYRTFKAFNPEWRQVQTLLVEPRFRLLPALSQAFPSADVQLSVFHACKHLQHKLHQVSLAFPTERLLLSALRIATCAPREGNLRMMHAILSEFVKPQLLPQPHKDWLLDERIWALHRWRTWGESSRYFKSLEVLTRSFSQVFCVGPSLESCITALARNYQKSLLKRSEEAAPGPDTLLTRNISSLHNLLNLSSSATHSLRPLLPRDVPPATPQALLEPKLEVGPGRAPSAQEAEATAEEAAEHIGQSLRDLCTEPAARLCLNELAVAQSSALLMGTDEGSVHIQILEEAQGLSRKGLGSCSCPFSQAFQLPCRHVLAVLNAEGRDLEPEQIPAQWRKGGPGASQGGQSSASGLLEVLRSSWDESLDKYLAVSFLTKQISQLLSQCSPQEFDRRYCTLRELADSWIGPYVQVKL